MLRKLLTSITALLLLAGQIGCYNTYNVSLDELAKAQEGGGSSLVKMQAASGEEIIVTESTKVGVTDKAGTNYAISPFNFTMTRGQIVAPDEDLLLSREEVQSGYVKEVSSTKTAILVTTGVVALLGAGLAIALTAEERKEFGE